MRTRKKLGEVLRDRNLLSDSELASALQQQNSKSVLLGELLLERGLVSRTALVEALEEITHVAYESAATAEPTEEALRAVPQETAVRYAALPVCVEGRRLVTIMAEPQNLNALNELRFISGMEIAPRLGFRGEILAALERCYAAPQSPPSGEILELLDSYDTRNVSFVALNPRNEAALQEAEAERRSTCTVAVRLFSALLQSAAAKKASDLHIEQLADEALVRIRVDGILREIARVPGETRSQLVSRIKILSDMDIAERRVPQDGRLLARIEGCELDLRVSTLPTQYGEKVVIRLLDSSVANVPFSELGLWAEQVTLLTSALSRPEGMLLVTGPTGSGKSTTLYSALNLLASPGVNIVSVEDPVEYVLPGVNQVQVNPKAGRTFAKCLRSMLRQDPNVVMIGEIRDGETADIALRAAQTGHLVLSTLHTNDSVSVITRLLDLGVPNYLVMSSLTATLAQRLVRKLCSCREMVAPSAEQLARLASHGITPHRNGIATPVGCKKCDGTGYKGRTGIYELFVVDEEVRDAIREGLSNTELRDMARANGMLTLYQHGMAKAAEGITTLDEVLRVVSPEETSRLSCSGCGQKLAASFKFCPSCGLRAGAHIVTPMRPGHRSHWNAVR